MDLAGGLGGLGALPDGPGPALVLAGGEVGDEAQQGVAGLDEPVQAGLGDAQVLQEHGLLVRLQLGDLGHFQAVIGSKGTKLEADFNASLIKRPRIVFRPSVTLKSVTGLAKFEKIVPDAPAPGGGDSESPDEI